MSPERETAVAAMKAMGWTADRDASGRHPMWKFSRPDTGGVCDVVTVLQSKLSMLWVADIAMKHDDAAELLDVVRAAKLAWLHQRFGALSKGG